jgi:hypothetical protein
MGGRRRDRDSERNTLKEAAERLLAGQPVHSSSGKLTISELIVESGLRRDVVYEHADLVDDFKLRARAQAAVPTSIQKIMDERAALKEELSTTKAALAREQESGAYLRRVIAEMSIELETLREQQAGGNQAPVPLPARRGRGRLFHSSPGR